MLLSFNVVICSFAAPMAAYSTPHHFSVKFLGPYTYSQTVSDHHILQEVISYATAWRRCTVCISMVDISLVAVVATSRGDTCSY